MLDIECLKGIGLSAVANKYITQNFRLNTDGTDYFGTNIDN